MVSSPAPDVDSYLNEVPAQRREVLSAIRQACQRELAGFTEVMTYGMPGYRRDGGEIEVAFASQKSYISLYILRTEVVAAHTDQLAGLDRGKGCIRFRRPAQVNLELVTSLLRATAQASGGGIC